MLVEKCPQLEDLTLTSRSPRLFDLKLFEGSWPVLKTLRIVYQGSSPLVDSSDMIPRDALYRFILRHPCIQDLTILHPFGIVPSFQQTGSTDDKRPPLQSLLPALKTYSGSPEILTHLSRLDLVESLSIKDHTVNFPWIGDQNLSKFFTVSQPRLCNLRRLSFQVKWLQLLTIKTGNTSLIHSIVDSCPNLEDLHIKTMTPTSTGEVKGVLHFLCQLRELKTLTFTKAPQSLFKGEIPLRTAIRAVRAVPSLDRVRIVHVQPYRVYERTREGVYDVIRGPGERVKLAVVERGQWKGLNAKIPWRGDTFNRTYFYSL
ncbi:hypothetical protein FA15DRAFT_413196 [Coprinopsis marcescibilis]|uniref:F-box domain-containing protein n=1 Tax=Coprinopsis marcescibilis TaxID=230819 RepID=A0A5C3KV22_COPMA|nr:hypothetical protein FA15DRAFT_413196 [Coprinopsis marcescibilis]